MTNNEEKTMNNEAAVVSEQAVRSEAVVYGSEACDYNCGGCDGGSDDWLEETPTDGSCEECCGCSGSDLLVTPNVYVMKKGDEFTLYVNKAVVWTSDDWSIVRVEQNGKITAMRDGSTTIRATADDGQTAYCSVCVDSRERIRVHRLEDCFYVTFRERSENVRWDSVARDFYGEIDELSRDPFAVDEEDRTTDEKNFIANSTKNFDAQQLAVLYRLNPIGVVQYVKYRASQMELVEGLKFKDRVYCEIFGYEELQDGHFYFTQENGQPFFGRYAESQRQDIYSMAELVFGFHTVVDWDKVVWSIAKIIFDAGPKLLSCIGTVLTVCEMCYSLFFVKSMEDTISIGVSEYVSDCLEKCGRDFSENIKWSMMNVLSSISDPLTEGIERLAPIDLDICKSVQKTDFRVELGSPFVTVDDVVSLSEWL